MSTRRLGSRTWIGLAAALAVAASLGRPALAAEPARAGDPKVAQAVDDLRSVGTAMYAWWVDHGKKRVTRAGSAAQEAYAKGDERDVTLVPAIPRADLERLLVPTYSVRVPELDPWGRPYEYRLNVSDPNAKSIMALRSAGADGRFSGDRYRDGANLVGDAAADLVWIDGYFVRWPGK